MTKALISGITGVWFGATPPAIAANALQLSAQLTPESRVVLTWNTTPGKFYTLVHAAEPGGPWTSWIVVQAVGVSSAEDVERAATGRFFRVRTGVDAPPNPRAEQLAWVPPGTYAMGSAASEKGRDPDEEPVTTVTISHGFWMGRREVRQEEYQALIGSNPSSAQNDPKRPVDLVTWSEAVTYCARLTVQARERGEIPVGYAYRLPTEAEWEYACRAGTTTRFYYGDDPDYSQVPQFAWYAPNGGWAPRPVGLKAPNPWGLYDMHGNACEWCQDWYAEQLPGGHRVDPRGPDSGWVRVTRGGAWYSSPWRLRSAWRSYFWPGYKGYNGIRVVLAPERIPAPGRSAVAAAGSPPSASGSTAPSDLSASLPRRDGSRVSLASPDPEPANPDPERLAWIPPGSFLMGSPVTEVGRAREAIHEEGPQTHVTLTRGFWMRKVGVTQQEFQALMGVNPSYFWRNADNPVEQVTWWEATNYCARLTMQERAAGRLPTGYQYRLPTEAERQYACRAGTTTRFSHGDDVGYTQLGVYAWYADNSGLTTHPVGQREPNPWGLHDMHGNLREWTLDWFGVYPGGEVIDYAGPRLGKHRTPVSGGWTQGAASCRSASREPHDPDYRSNHVGFRPVLAPEGWPDPGGRW